MDKSPISIKITKILKNLPGKPGVYLMKNEAGNVIYVGKAILLKNRVRQYFNKAPNHSLGTQVMMKYVSDIDFIVVSSDIEALMLENTLIKQYMPKYNVRLRDDKNFSYIKIRTRDCFPEIYTVRQLIRDGSKYFGPYTSTFNVKRTLKLIQTLFPYRTCSGDILVKESFQNKDEMPTKENIILKKLSRRAPCLDYHLKRCLGPCIGKVSENHYKAIIENIILFLKGDFGKIVSMLEEKMKLESAKKNFEVCMKIRDQIISINDIMQRQKVVSTKDLNQDVLTAVFHTKDKGIVNLLEIRLGKLIDVKNIELDYVDSTITIQDFLTKFILQYYEKTVSLPKEILIKEELEDKAGLEKWFKETLHQDVSISIPTTKEKKGLLQIGEENIREYALKIAKEVPEFKKDEASEALKEIMDKFALDKKPDRMECYDISHMGGTETVGSMTVFKDGKPYKKDYRSFKINTVNTPGASDDYKSMHEIFERRFRYLSEKRTVSLEERGMVLKSAKKEDLKEIKKILKVAGLDSSNLDKNQVYNLIKDKEIVGIALIKEVIKDLSVEISSLWIEPKLEENGLGNIFVARLLDKIKEKKVYVLALKERMDSFYALSFKDVNKGPLKLIKKKKIISKSVETKILVHERKEKVIEDSLTRTPDLIVIDGGKGQLNEVIRVMNQFQLNLNLVGFAKEENAFFLPQKKVGLFFKEGSVGLKLLTNIRDEAHRFANEYRTKLGLKKMTKSVLDDIPGVGQKMKNKLLKKFGSVHNLKEAGLEEIAEIVGEKNALKIVEII